MEELEVFEAGGWWWGTAGHPDDYRDEIERLAVEHDGSRADIDDLRIYRNTSRIMDGCYGPYETEEEASEGL